jgi:hypothetical protein
MDLALDSSVTQLIIVSGANFAKLVYCHHKFEFDGSLELGTAKNG